MSEELPLKFRRAEWGAEGYIKVERRHVALVSTNRSFDCQPSDLIRLNLFGYHDNSCKFDGILEISIHPFYRVEGHEAK